MSILSAILEGIAALFILIGAAFVLLGSLGLARLPDFFTRLHAPTKASTLGIGALLIASMVLSLSAGRLPGFAELLLTLFIFLTAPVGANMLSIAAFRNIGRVDGTDPGDGQNDEPVSTVAPATGKS